MKRIGFTSGSFDPVTNGHLDVIARAARMVDTLVIGIGVHPGKTPLFSTDEKIEMLKAETAAIAKKTGARSRSPPSTTSPSTPRTAVGATLIFRGLRDGTDFDYEMQMAGMNGAMAPGIDTVFLPASPGVRHITATLVRQIAMMGGDVSDFVSPGVARRLEGEGRQEQAIEAQALGLLRRPRKATRRASFARARGSMPSSPLSPAPSQQRLEPFVIRFL